MDLSNLRPAKGSVKKVKRIGRGEGSGRGGTSTRGHKGAGQRSGTSKKIGFEGGQMPLARRVPKFGFKNINRKEYKAINLSSLQRLVDMHQLEQINPEVLRQHGLIRRKDLYKILAKGELKAKIEVHAHGFSASAAKAIEAAGGNVVKI
ncbi:MAG: 50S ribosomal protein L15 [Bacteroidales bacterium]|jgi:large subunit ribosomal protein L15|nr:50S ribosomal protein L15 [Bacteroidales bacterium]MCK9449210.1 50S ribosomal protein L15 [Bacteroidales bacterium]MDD3701752.1 50S ribosomal protein L15 [Bacteroidales bacterium]MDY0370133.1 50S ribosomal protein L15 [Bacteroidales bacterium]